MYHVSFDLLNLYLLYSPWLSLLRLLSQFFYMGSASGSVSICRKVATAIGSCHRLITVRSIGLAIAIK